MTKIVINGCYGGFGLSTAGVRMYLKLKGKEVFVYNQKGYYPEERFEKVKDDNLEAYRPYYALEDLGDVTDDIGDFFSYYNLDRSDPDLIKVVEELGSKANGPHASLRVVEIPDDVKWEISEYDGIETVEEVHRSWG